MNAGNLILWNLWTKFTLHRPVELGMGAAIVHRITGDTHAWEAAVSPCLLSSVSSRAVIRVLPKSFMLSLRITSINIWYIFLLVEELLYNLKFNSLILGIAWKLQLMCFKEKQPLHSATEWNVLVLDFTVFFNVSNISPVRTRILEICVRIITEEN